MLRSVFRVRRYKALATTDVPEAGDGKGTENAFPCAGSNQLVLFIEALRPDTNTTKFTVLVEYSSGGDDPYRDTTGTAVAKSEYTISGSDLPAANVSARYAIVTPIRDRIARVSVAATWTGGSPSAPSVSLRAATASTVGGEGALVGRHLVRRAATLLAGSNNSKTGDGLGGENPVPIHRGDRVVLYVAGNLRTNATLEIYMETSVDGSSFHREMWYDPAGVGSVQAIQKKYSISYTQFGGADVDGFLTVPIDALGAWARFTFTALTDQATNLACHALVGRA